MQEVEALDLVNNEIGVAGRNIFGICTMFPMMQDVEADGHAIPIGLEAIASRVEAIALRLEAERVFEACREELAAVPMHWDGDPMSSCND